MNKSNEKPRPSYCCRLDQEFICGIVRNRSGIDSGCLDWSIRVDRTKQDAAAIVRELERLTEKVRRDYLTGDL